MSSWLLVVVFLYKLLLLFLTATLTNVFIPYLGFFPYKETLKEYGLPQVISAFANFDGVHYLLIAKQGYSQYEQAFFPLYPLLIRLFSPLFHNNRLIAGLVISSLSFLLGLWILLKLTEISKQKTSSFWLILFILAFPTAFFFHSVYTEGWFFLLFITSLYLIKQKHYFWGGVVAALASATRLVGVFIFIPLLFSFVANESKKKRKNWLASIYVLLPFVGFFVYMLYLFKTTGDPLFFFNAQPAFGANRSTRLIFLPQVYYRYIKIFFLSQKNFAYYIAIFEFVIFNFVFIVSLYEFLKHLRGKNLFFASLALFSLINIFLPTLTGTLSSIPRYALFSLSVFFFLANLGNKTLKLAILLILLFLQILLAGFFLQGYFVS